MSYNDEYYDQGREDYEDSEQFEQDSNAAAPSQLLSPTQAQTATRYSASISDSCKFSAQKGVILVTNYLAVADRVFYMFSIITLRSTPTIAYVIRRVIYSLLYYLHATDASTTWPHMKQVSSAVRGPSVNHTDSFFDIYH